MKDIKALRNSPYKNLLPFILKYSPEKSSVLINAPISGVISPFTIVFTMFVKAAPTTTPTAKSTAFPLKINCLNPLNIKILLLYNKLQKITKVVPCTQGKHLGKLDPSRQKIL